MTTTKADAGAAPPPAAHSAPKSRVMAALSSIGPPITVLSSVLVFFGWVKAGAEASYMGLNVNLYGYTTQDYVLFSVSHLSLALVFVFVAGIGCMALHGWFCRRINQGAAARPRMRRLAGAVAAVGILAAVVSLLLVALLPERNLVYAPYVMAAGVLLAAWAVRMYRLAHAGEPEARSIQQRAGESALLFGLVALLLFWGAANHAQVVGVRAGMDLEQHVDELPRAQLYSTAPLATDVPAVTEATVGTKASPVYRYDGLRLQSVSGGNLFFLPEGWTAKTGSVIVLPNNNSFRVEYGR